MTRLATDPSARLDTLVAARSRVTGEHIANAKELAKVVGVSWRIMDQWIAKDAEFPIVQRGGPGVAWVFNVGDVLDHLIGRARGKQIVRDARMEETARLSGFAAPTTPSNDRGGDATADMGAVARALKSMGEAQMIAHRLKREQGEYVLADGLANMLGELISTLQSEWLGAAARADPAGTWPAHIRAAWDDEARNVLVTVNDRLTEWLAQQRLARAA